MLPFSETAVAPLTKGQVSYKRRNHCKSELFKAICLILFRCNRSRLYSGSSVAWGLLLTGLTREIIAIQFIYWVFPMSDTVLRTGLTNTMRQFILCPFGHLQFCGRASIPLSSLIPEASLCALIEWKFLLHFCLFVCFSSVSCISSASMEASVLVVQLDLPISSLAQDSAPFLDPTVCPTVSCWSRLRDLFNYPVCAQHTHTHRI